MSTSEYHMYVYDMPYATRRALCGIIDINHKWEELAGVYMKFDVVSVQRLSQAILRHQSPTDELLTLWGTQNHTVLELFILLSKMQHYQAMRVLKDFVDPKYHRLIYEGEENISRLFGSPKVDTTSYQQTNAHNDNFKFGDHNFNHPNFKKESHKVFDALEGGQPKDQVPKTGGEKEVGCGARGLSEASNGLVGDNASPMISYLELEEATGKWNRKHLLGKGGFGNVYKGLWKNTHVAVKRLEVQKDGDDLEETWKTHREQSLRELKYLNSCRHDNILPLYGFSINGPYDCLVYQFMLNGSLEDRLLCRDSSKPPLTWSQRHNIATGTARGLQFLHRLGDKPLIHGDIKSANILLDLNLEPKIGDFGLAREGPLQQYTHVKVSRVHGTRPYLPDEFLRAKKFSTKVDTFSFGIVLFELATGLRAYDDSRQYKYLKDEVETADDGKLSDLKDIKAGVEETTFYRLIDLGRLCVSSKPKDRPEMVAALGLLVTPHHQDAQPLYQNWNPFSHNAGTQNQFLPALDILGPSGATNQVEDILPLISELGIKTDVSGRTDSSN